MKSVYLKLSILLLILAAAASCGKDDSAPETVPPPELKGTALDLRDVANAGDASDFEFSFSKPNSEDLIAEFRIFAVKSANSSTFDSLAATQVAAGNYLSIGPTTTTAGLVFDPSFVDIDGDQIQEGNSYTFFVLTKPTEESALGSELSEPSQDLSLEQKSAVRTLTDSFVAGSGGMDVDAAGNIYMGDFGAALGSAPGTKVFKITPTGEVSTFAAGLVGASGNDFDNAGNLFQSNIGGGTLSKISPDGTVAPFATGFQGPVGVAFDGSSNFYVCNCSNNTISKVDLDGNVSLFSSSGLMSCPNGIDIDESGNLYVANFGNGTIVKITPGGTASSLATIPGNNMGHLLVQGNFIYVVARGLNRIYKVTLQGSVTKFAGTGARGLSNGSLDEATFSLPNDMAFSPDGSKIYINDVATSNSDTGVISPVVIRVIDLVEP
ncbi:MAG: SMP-30/gluconolactonase/LRE family protein [Cyclobacteriaceae bacterium]